MTALTLGPVLFNWPADEWRDFHFRMADEAPYDTVCLGEVVCAKRWPFLEPHVAQVTERLERAGKEVVFSSLALVMNAREAGMVQALSEDGGRLVEANDLSAIAHLQGRPHAVGPFISTYNEGTLVYFEARGAVRVALPAELPGPSIAVLAAAATAELEIQVFGRLPLALSARCYHARSRDLTKDSCNFVCIDDPGGMELETLDGEPFLAVNGTQTLSHGHLNLLGELGALKQAGIPRFRILPQPLDMVAVGEIFADVLAGRLEAEAGTERLAALTGEVPFTNGFYHGEAGEAWVAPQDV